MAPINQKPGQAQVTKQTDQRVQLAQGVQKANNLTNIQPKEGVTVKQSEKNLLKKKSPEEEFSEYVPPGYEFEMKRKRDRDTRKPGGGDYQSKLMQKVKGFYDMSKTLPRNLFAENSHKQLQAEPSKQATRKSLDIAFDPVRPEEGEGTAFQSRLEHSSSKSRSNKSPGKSPKRRSPKKPKSGIGYFENQFPKVRLEQSKPPTREFRRSESDSRGFFHSARTTTSARFQDGLWPSHEVRESYLFGRKEGSYTYTKQYNHYDFSKTLPRSGLKKAKSTKNQAAYNPSYKVIEKKMDKLCIPFDKLVGRSQPEISTRTSEPSLPTRMRLLSQIEKRQQLAIRLESLEQSAKSKRTPSTGIEPLSGRRFFGLRAPPNPKESERSGGVVQLPTNPSQMLRTPLQSPFPGWLRKASTATRLGLTQTGEKACEMNHFSTGPQRAHEELGRGGDKARRTLERFKLQQPQDDAEEFDDLASDDYAV